MQLGYDTTTQLPFSISSQDRTRHLALFGKTGTGKTTVLERLIAQDIRDGRGLCVLDPHGELAEAVLSHVPKNRWNDVIYFNPAEGRVPPINLFEVNGHTSHIVSSLVRIIKNIWPDYWGPRSEWLLTNLAFALLQQQHPVSIVSLYKLMTDRGVYKRRVVAQVKDPALIRFFAEYDHWTKPFREQVVTPLLHKVSAFVQNEYLRMVMGQSWTNFKFRWMIDNRKIFIANLSKGKLGDDVSSLIGSAVFTKIAIAALSREDTKDRPQFTVYADEVQNFIHGVNFPSVLSESRKYGLEMVIATQTIAGLGNDATEAIFGNCGTILTFQTGGEDAKRLQLEFGDIYPSRTFIETDKWEAWVRSLKSGHPTKPYLIRTLAPDPSGKAHGYVRRLKAHSLRRWGRPKEKIKAKIDRFLRS